MCLIHILDSKDGLMPLTSPFICPGQGYTIQMHPRYKPMHKDTHLCIQGRNGPDLKDMTAILR